MAQQPGGDHLPLGGLFGGELHRRFDERRQALICGHIRLEKAGEFDLQRLQAVGLLGKVALDLFQAGQQLGIAGGSGETGAQIAQCGALLAVEDVAFGLGVKSALHECLLDFILYLLDRAVGPWAQEGLDSGKQVV